MVRRIADDVVEVPDEAAADWPLSLRRVRRRIDRSEFRLRNSLWVRVTAKNIPWDDGRETRRRSL